MLPLRQRWAPVVLVLVGAPIGAEYLQAYLDSTGDVTVMAGSLLVLGPLYGGAALLIREVAVRRGLGWTGVLLLAGGFGLLMPGVVDLALFAEHRDEIAYWDEMRQGTLVAPLGVSAYTALTWTAGHVVLSVGVPLALLAALAPRHRDRPLLGRWGVVATAATWLLVAAVIRSDGVRIYDYRPSAAQTLVVLAVVAALVGVALTRVGRPVAGRGTRRSSPRWLLAAGAVGVLALDMTPWTWAGVSVLTAVLAGSALAARRRSIARSWSPHDVGALAAGALVGRAAGAFLSPAPEGVTTAAKLAQNGVLLAGTVAIAWLVLGRGRSGGAPGRGTGRRVRGIGGAGASPAASRPASTRS